MSDTITTTQLLDFLAKAHKVASYVNVKEGNGYYNVTVTANWDEDDYHYDQTVTLTQNEDFDWSDNNSKNDMDTMSYKLGVLVREEEEREMKRQKRQELLSRLTDEEKELLGVN